MCQPLSTTNPEINAYLSFRCQMTKSVLDNTAEITKSVLDNTAEVTKTVLDNTTENDCVYLTI